MTFLPETASSKLPDTIEDGERLGKGDTLYSAIYKLIKYRKASKNQPNGVDLNNVVA